MISDQWPLPISSLPPPSPHSSPFPSLPPSIPPPPSNLFPQCLLCLHFPHYTFPRCLLRALSPFSRACSACISFLISSRTLLHLKRNSPSQYSPFKETVPTNLLHPQGRVVLYSSLLYLAPHRFHYVGGARIETRTVVTSTLTVRHSNLSARSHLRRKNTSSFSQ
jgi:hypothetical protein